MLYVLCPILGLIMGQIRQLVLTYSYLGVTMILFSIKTAKICSHMAYSAILLVNVFSSDFFSNFLKTLAIPYMSNSLCRHNEGCKKPCLS